MDWRLLLLGISLGALIFFLVLNHGGGDGPGPPAPAAPLNAGRGCGDHLPCDGTGLYCDGDLFSYNSVNEGCCNPVDACPNPGDVCASYYCSSSITTDPVGKYCDPVYRDDLCTTERHFCNGRLYMKGFRIPGCCQEDLFTPTEACREEPWPA